MSGRGPIEAAERRPTGALAEKGKWAYNNPRTEASEPIRGAGGRRLQPMAAEPFSKPIRGAGGRREVFAGE